MNNELVVSKNETNESFIAKLNNAIGFTEGLPPIPTLKFDAQAGKFMRSTDEKDREGKTIYEELTEQIEFHILTTRKMVQSAFNTQPFLYSREFTGNYVELLNENKQVVVKGFYKDLKANNPNLKFVQLLYVMFEGNPYKLKLAGTKLQNLYPYLSSFVNDSPAAWLSLATKGQQVSNGSVKYFELIFEKGERITNQQLIVERVNDINYYISAKARALNHDNIQIEEVAPSYELEERQEEIEVDQMAL